MLHITLYGNYFLAKYETIIDLGSGEMLIPKGDGTFVVLKYKHAKTKI